MPASRKESLGRAWAVHITSTKAQLDLGGGRGMLRASGNGPIFGRAVRCRARCVFAVPCPRTKSITPGVQDFCHALHQVGQQKASNQKTRTCKQELVWSASNQLRWVYKVQVQDTQRPSGHGHAGSSHQVAYRRSRLAMPSSAQGVEAPHSAGLCKGGRRERREGCCCRGRGSTLLFGNSLLLPMRGGQSSCWRNSRSCRNNLLTCCSSGC